MAKKEKIAEVLQQEFDKGHYEAVTPAFSQVPEVIRIKTEQGAYSFPNDKDMWKSIDSRQKALDRVISNRQNYGDDRGRCAVFKDNKTALDLGLLKGRPDYLRCAYRSWLMAQNAPEKLRRYVYHNLIVMCNRYHGDAEKFYLQDISDYTFQVLPPAWRKCMDEECPELKDVTLGDVLEQYLLEIVREKMGDVYSPMLQMGASKYPSPTYTLMIMLSCSPQKTDKLADVCLDILKTVGKKGTDKKTLAKVKKQLISTREKNIQTNSFWRSYIQGKVLYGDDMNAVNEYADMVNSVTKKDLVNFMKKYFNYDNYTRVDLKPEK